MTLPSGRQVSYSRDSLQRIQSIATDIDSISQTVIDGIAYNAAGQIIQRRYDNGLVKNHRYDLLGGCCSKPWSMSTGLYYDANSNLPTRNTGTHRGWRRR